MHLGRVGETAAALRRQLLSGVCSCRLQALRCMLERALSCAVIQATNPAFPSSLPTRSSPSTTWRPMTRSSSLCTVRQAVQTMAAHASQGLNLGWLSLLHLDCRSLLHSPTRLPTPALSPHFPSALLPHLPPHADHNRLMKDAHMGEGIITLRQVGGSVSGAGCLQADNIALVQEIGAEKTFAPRVTLRCLRILCPPSSLLRALPPPLPPQLFEEGQLDTRVPLTTRSGTKDAGGWVGGLGWLAVPTAGCNWRRMEQLAACTLHAYPPGPLPAGEVWISLRLEGGARGGGAVGAGTTGVSGWTAGCMKLCLV